MVVSRAVAIAVVVEAAARAADSVEYILQRRWDGGTGAARDIAEGVVDVSIAGDASSADGDGSALCASAGSTSVCTVFVLEWTS